jgi:hypothetical protein
MDTIRDYPEAQDKSAEALAGAAEGFFTKFKMGTILNRSGITKAKGISPRMIVMSIFCLAFTGKNFFRGIVQNESEPFCKDAAYDLMKSPTHNWRRVLLALAAKLVSFFSPLTCEEREKVLIIDDSPYDRSRSKKVELLARVYDHAADVFIRGFRLLTVCWSDGVSLIPLDFALLSSSEKKNRYQEITKKNLDKRTCGHKRRTEAMTKATELVGAMVARIISYGIRVDYVLMDSWFGWPVLISELHKCAPVICMVKRTEKVLYGYAGGHFDVKAIYRRLKKRPGKAKILADVVVTLTDGTPVKLVFVRNRKKRGDWLVLLSSDTALANEEIVRLYGRRWDIEVFFKMAKQHLKLSKEIQSRDFDSLIAHTSIVFMRYQFLAFEQRMRTDCRTFGDMFYACCDELGDITLLESLRRILTLAIDKLRKARGFAEEAYRTLFNAIMGEAIVFLGLDKSNYQKTQEVT